ncbi:MAG: PilT/PilU family type 4a pilus ATPase [Chloroflexi bacterium]|nr:PilT/PilU family type 4a pilus ATPase [Chloroflexota bacterium]MBM3154799.1 PilT/PilU family type 4a pilus ATPase [Chloroflexota bacterium]MBM3172519.1 PilT/PilU family type 4a pilus ATPase [Chloroflexota bacterium]MBM3175213.1 PilT/PilU family type 4a pilus ATPase [Chloroflexota bacterium]MBM4450326.1 PilT/PilU family type 4a pilus ATPase [Chloroflexota bacterium]
MDIHALLRQAVEKRASDLHLIAFSPPLFRIDGALHPFGDTAVSGDDLNDMFAQVTTEQQREIFQRELELDFAFSLADDRRIRCNACLQRGEVSLALRLLPPRIPTIDELGLPQLCKDLITRPRGLIVVTGPTGSGKSTTIAAMIRHLNHTERRYLVTIEDPVEYVHPNVECAVSQRELASDTWSFANALKHVLRQDPDVILVGEMRDLETAAAVLTVAETGHLILSTGHAPSAAQSVERIVDLFPPHERPMAQARLASVLIGVLCQALVPKIGGGRVVAVEVMLANAAVKNLIREGKAHLLPNTIRTHASSGMRTLDDALIELHRRQVITWESVLAFCQDAEEVAKLASRGQNKAG